LIWVRKDADRQFSQKDLLFWGSAEFQLKLRGNVEGWWVMTAGNVDVWQQVYSSILKEKMRGPFRGIRTVFGEWDLCIEGLMDRFISTSTRCFKIWP
jgi:hypothetical protein